MIDYKSISKKVASDWISQMDPVVASDSKFLIRCPSSDKASEHQIREVLDNMGVDYEEDSIGSETFFNTDADTNDIQKLRNVRWRNKIVVE